MRTPLLCSLPVALLAACGPGGLPAPTVSLAPTAPTTGDDLVASATFDAVDVEGGPVTYRYAWLRDGRAVPSLTEATVPSDLTAKGEGWSVRVTAEVGELTSDAGEASVRIANSPPTATVSIAPTEASAGAELVATASGEDLDKDAVGLAYAWFRNGAPEADLTTDTVPAGRTARGETWRVQVTPSDGEDAGPPATAEVRVTNGPPTILDVQLRPERITVADDVVAVVQTEDPDGDRVQTGFAWVVDGQPAGTAGVLSRSVLRRGVSVELTVTATDGTLEATPFTVGPVVVANAPPAITEVTVSPSSGVTVRDTLTCSASGQSDAEDDPITLAYAWSADGAPLVGRTGATLDLGSGVAKGATITCRATPSDGLDDGAAVTSAGVPIGNAAPEVVSARVAAASIDDPITVADLLTADPDAADTVTVTYAWYVDGAPAGTSASLPAGSAARGTPVRCVLTPTDSDGLAGAPFSTDTTTVGNRDPVITSVTLSPASPTAEDDLVATATATDPDNDPVEIVYTWYLDDGVEELPITGIVGDTLPGGESALFRRGDIVRVEATPVDPYASGEPVSTAPVTIVNAAPHLTGATLGPAGFSRATPTVTCTPTGFRDADLDLPSYTYAWTIGGVASGSGATRPGTAFAKGQSVSCTVTPSDGTTAGTPVTATASVGNAPPTLQAVTVGPNQPREIDTILATAVGLDDPDPGDAGNLSVRYVWYVDDQEVEGVSGDSLTGTHFDRGDSVRAQGFPSDGTDEGTPADSTSTVTVVNSPPTISSLTLSPASPDTTDDIVASYVAVDLDENDTITPVFQWSINAVTVAGVNGATLPKARTKKNDAVRVTLTVSDGQASASKPIDAPLLVQNAPPATPIVAVVPPRVSAGGRPLFCALVQAAVDPDPLDIVQYTVRWTRDGQPYGGQPGDVGPIQTALLNDTVPAADVGPNETWVCTIVANDGNKQSSGSATAVSWSGDLDSLTSGSGFSCGLATNGKAVCWGLNDLGQASPPTAAISWRHLDAGPDGVCGLQTAGTIGCWGASALRTGVPIGAYLDVQVGYSFGCALSTTGGLACWGDDSNNQTVPPGGTWRALAVGSFHACALGTNGKPFCWGYNEDGQASGAPDEVLTHMAAGTRFTCGLRPDGSVTCWGAPLQSAPSGSDRFVDLVAGTQSVCGLRQDGTAACWIVQGSTVAITPPSGPWAFVGPGNAHACGVRTDGSLSCWGDGTDLQLQPPLLEIDELAVGTAHACALLPDDTVTCWGNKSDNRLQVPAGTFADALSLGSRHSCAVLTTGALSCWGSNAVGQKNVPVGTSWTQLDAGTDHTCAIDSAGALACWGSPADGRTTVPALTAPATWVDVSAGAEHTCGIDSDYFPYCWGNNGSARATPPAATQVFDIAAGDAHTCAVTLAGSLTCWGISTQNRLNAPGGSFWEQVVAGAQHSCALTGSGSIQCWGNTADGRTSAPTTGTYSRLVAGEAHTCALRDTDGAWVCWGRYAF